MKNIVKIKDFLFKHKSKVLFVIVVFILHLSAELFFLTANFKNSKQPYVLAYILGFGLFFFLMLLITTVLGNLKRSTIFASILLLLLMIANQLKIIYSSEPIFISDLTFINSGDTFLEILDGTILEAIKKIMPSIALFVVTVIGLFFFVKKVDVKFSNIKFRIIYATVSMVVIIILFFPTNTIHSKVLSTFYEHGTNQGNHPTTAVKYYFLHSFFGGLYGEYLLNDLIEPEDYNKDEVKKIINNSIEEFGKVNPNSNEKALKKPNIIMVFSESFFDIDKISEVEFDKPITKNFNELKEMGLHFNMISSVLGGLSANPEFEILTSGNLSYYPGSYIPYMNLYEKGSKKITPSLISELKNNDYETVIFSTWSKNLFQCGNVYEKFGVDKTIYKSDLIEPEKKGGRISDEFVKDEIVNYFNNKQKGKNAFYMALTAQAHMPYKADKYEGEYDIKVKQSSLSSEKTDVIRSYAQGVYDADKQLKQLYDYIQTLDEDTILIFYGDHLPFLKTSDGYDIYQELEYFNTKDSLLNEYRIYNTECLILSNYDMDYDSLDYNVNEDNYLSYDYIMPYLLNNMDVTVSKYYQYIYSIKDKLPAFNRFVSVDSKGNLYRTYELKSEMLKTYKNREKVNWNYYIEE